MSRNQKARAGRIAEPPTSPVHVTPDPHRPTRSWWATAPRTGWNDTVNAEHERQAKSQRTRSVSGVVVGQITK